MNQQAAWARALGFWSALVITLLAFGFTLLFAAAVSINRFTRLGVVRQRWLRALALASAVGFLLGSSLSLLGFLAWGLVLYVFTGLLAAHFRRGGPSAGGLG